MGELLSGSICGMITSYRGVALLSELDLGQGGGDSGGDDLFAEMGTRNPADQIDNSVVPIWVRLFGLQDELQSKEGLGRISSVLGKPLCTDLRTRKREKVRYAKVCVELIVDSPLVEHISFTPNVFPEMFVDVSY
ncbi:unnamed protein product [Linum tenue]|uniref:DUF4283 domain-containing protein n=1 Tax=Linum tenue TaxID=586396 RepID=A0AAV0LDA5_9ROSI|nr:unnamed protein product [Linum tenue]